MSDEWPNIRRRALRLRPRSSQEPKLNLTSDQEIYEAEDATAQKIDHYRSLKDVPHSWRPIGYKEFSALGWAIAHNKKQGTLGRMNQYLLLDKTDKILQNTEIESVDQISDFPDFMKVYYEKVGANRVIWHQLQRDKSGEWDNVDNSWTEQPFDLNKMRA
jgi:hypothetical protein